MIEKMLNKLLSMVLIATMVIPVFTIPVSAATIDEQDTMDRLQEASGELVLPNGANVDMEKKGESRFFFVTEDDGSITEIEVNDTTGIVLVDGRNVITYIGGEDSGISTRDNWGSPSTERFSLEVAGMSAGTLSIVLAAKIPSAKWSLIVAVAGDIVEKALSKVYYQGITQLNYVDYSPKVGYRLTEELYSSSSYSSSSRLMRSTMTGSR